MCKRVISTFWTMIALAALSGCASFATVRSSGGYGRPAISLADTQVALSPRVTQAWRDAGMMKGDATLPRDATLAVAEVGECAPPEHTRDAIRSALRRRVTFVAAGPRVDQSHLPARPKQLHTLAQFKAYEREILLHHAMQMTSAMESARRSAAQQQCDFVLVLLSTTAAKAGSPYGSYLDLFLFLPLFVVPDTPVEGSGQCMAWLIDVASGRVVRYDVVDVAKWRLATAVGSKSAEGILLRQIESEAVWRIVRRLDAK